MTPVPHGIYSVWRSQNLAPLALHEGTDAPVPAERLLQAVWHHQRLQRERLQTLDGRPIRILHPGFPNREAGPDFRDAVLQFETERPCVGDIEIDLRSSHWQAHGHHQNPGFQKVLLHVIWETPPAAPPRLPTLVIQSVLDAPITELALWLGSDAARDWPGELAGHCAARLARLAEPGLKELLRQAARCRLEAKAAQFQARARLVGWEPALWEGLFRALGYKHNVWPMQRLAELLTHWTAPAASPSVSPFVWQARLLGLAGLLPDETLKGGAEAACYLRRAWDYWWRERDACHETILPRQMWCFHGLRPVNHPQRRLALAAHWLATGTLLARLESWLTTNWPDAELVDSLHAVFQVEQDEFWCWHWTLRSKKSTQPRPLLGAARVSDLAVNVVLPWFWMRAAVGKNAGLQRALEHRYFAWPRGEDNAALRLARRRLLPSYSAKVLDRAAHQQGLLQITRDFCDHSNATCAECRFPALVSAGGLQDPAGALLAGG